MSAAPHSSTPRSAAPLLASPINLQAWIDANRHLLKPPVGNKVIESGDFIIMVVGGPNARTDYHYDEGAEWFYQLEGDMVLRVQVPADGASDAECSATAGAGCDEATSHRPAHGNATVVRDIPIRAGEVFLLPPRVPHSPQRMADSVGLVIERRRRADEQDGLLWFCERCNHKLYEQYFPLRNIETDFPPVFDRFYASTALRTCARCGHLNPAPAKYATAVS